MLRFKIQDHKCNMLTFSVVLILRTFSDCYKLNTYIYIYIYINIYINIKTVCSYHVT